MLECEGPQQQCRRPTGGYKDLKATGHGQAPRLQDFCDPYDLRPCQGKGRTSAITQPCPPPPILPSPPARFVDPGEARV
jgi:hypothetical protein